MRMEVLTKVPAYSGCGILGFILGMLYLIWISKRTHLRFDDLVYIYVWAAVGAILGAKILYIIIEMRRIWHIKISDISMLFSYIKILLTGGFVFYGGLIGAITATYIAARYFKYNIDTIFNVLTPIMPFAHAFGRIGCLITGCCYGIEVEKAPYIVYRNSMYAPNGIKLFPVQGIEALLDIGIAGYLVIRKNKECQRPIIIDYLILYGVVRFLLEFFRGDYNRGYIGILSVSQWISIFILVITLFLNYKKLIFFRKR